MKSQGRHTGPEELHNAPPRVTTKGRGVEAVIGQPIETLLPERYRAIHPEQVRGIFRNPKHARWDPGRELFARRKSGAQSIGASRLGQIRAEVEPSTNAIEGNRLTDLLACVEAELRAVFAFPGSMP